jgi:S-adenosylmethionine/arginine decarboxylase-like enzyme
MENQMKPFGVSYLLDMYRCRQGAADDLELNYRFLEQLVDIIGMTKQCNPLVFHGPTAKGVELYPDKAGVSAWIPLIESGIQIHTIEPKRFISLDIYTCGAIDTAAAREFARKTFGFERCEERFLERGTEYNA